MAKQQRTLRSAFKSPASDIADSFALNYGPDGVGKVLAAQKALHMKIQHPLRQMAPKGFTSVSPSPSMPRVASPNSSFSVSSSQVRFGQRSILSSIFGTRPSAPVGYNARPQAANDFSFTMMRAPSLRLAA